MILGLEPRIGPEHQTKRTGLDLNQPTAMWNCTDSKMMLPTWSKLHIYREVQLLWDPSNT